MRCGAISAPSPRSTRGRFNEEIVAARRSSPDGAGRRSDADEGPRRDTSLEALAKLRPAFHVNGTVTAGNSSQTSDGAAAVVVMSADRARELGLTPLGRFVAFATAGVEPERFGIGPVPAIRKVLKLAGLTLDQIDLVELNEAFAAQVIACLRELPIDPDRLNVNGGAIALGHPLGCTGAQADDDDPATRCGGATPATDWSRCASAAAWARRASSNGCEGATMTTTTQRPSRGGTWLLEEPPATPSSRRNSSPTSTG